MLTREQLSQKRWEVYKELAIYQIESMNRPDFGWANVGNKEEILLSLYDAAKTIARVFNENDK